MRIHVVLGVVMAVVASMATTGVILVVSQEVEPKSETFRGLRPDEITKLPSGTPVSDLALDAPIDYGPFRVMPAGSAPTVCDEPLRSGVEKAAHDQLQPDSLDELSSHDLFVDPPFLPKGWVLSEALASTITWSDDATTDSSFDLYYEHPEYFYISVQRWVVAPGCKIEVFDGSPESEHALTLSDIDGVSVVIQHQAPGKQIQAIMQVFFQTGSVVTVVESVALDLDDLMSVAKGVISATKGQSS